jgi:inosine guanosine and xanthosine phosphorylase family
MQKLKKVQICADALQKRLPEGFAPLAGIVLGTGLGNLAQKLEQATQIPFSDLPDFPLSTTQSHRGAFIAGFLAGTPVLLQQGRCHIYEGRTPDDVCMGVRVMATLGIRSLVVTNAAGALNPQFDVGGLMLLTDHINMCGHSPLRGPNIDAWGPRFPDMSAVYDREFIRIAEEKALALGLRLERGVYIGLPGPELETPAETRAYRLLGADAVGMSTVLEVIAARHMGVRVLGISCLSNKNLPDCMEKMTIEDIIAETEKAGGRLAALLLAALPEIACARSASGGQAC